MFAGIVYAVGGLIQALIALRFLLRLLGANPSSSFVDWIYNWSTPFVKPFSGIFGQDATVTGPGVVTASVFDWTALIALVVVAIIMAVLGRILTPKHR